MVLATPLSLEQKGGRNKVKLHVASDPRGPGEEARCMMHSFITHSAFPEEGRSIRRSTKGETALDARNCNNFPAR